jgi:3-oxoacyl-[acyl-carrier protein] reductase
MKKVLITGGSGDIAKAIAEQLKIVGGYEIFTPGKDMLDVTNITQIENYINNVCPDIIINNAGHIIPSDIAENQWNGYKKSIDINLTGTFLCTGFALQKNKDTMIINIGSSAGTTNRASWSAYCAAKAAVIMATKCWADEGLKVVCISPGRTQSKMRKALFPNENQNSLLKAADFAKIVVKAINGEYAWGNNIDVNINNINTLLNGK